MTIKEKESRESGKGLITFKYVSKSDYPGIVEIFNYYILNSEAAFLEEPVTEGFFEHIISMLVGYPVVSLKDSNNSLLGFGMLRPYNPLPVFRHTAEIGYFIRPDLTGQGLGRRLLFHLEGEGKKMNIQRILAPISSKNEGSLRFHHNCGFVECGRFFRAGMKRGEFFDLVWMEKDIAP